MSANDKRKAEDSDNEQPVQRHQRRRIASTESKQPPTPERPITSPQISSPPPITIISTSTSAISPPISTTISPRSTISPKSSTSPKTKSPIQSLPIEIIIRILTHLSPHDLVQTSAVCRELYFVALDPLLWRNLDLSRLHSNFLSASTATTIKSRLNTCRHFTLKEPSSLTRDHVSALLHFLAASPFLERLHIMHLGPLLNSHSLEQHFRLTRSRCLSHVDLSHSPVTTPAVIALMSVHRGTLRSLDLSHTSIGDGTLRAVSKAMVLHTLDISACPSISRTSIRNFLCRNFPGCLVTLSLRALKDVKITWLYDLMKLPGSAALRALNVHGCERLSLGDLEELKEAWGGRVLVGHDARDGADTVWAYRRYIEFLSGAPSLPERLAGAAGGECGDKAEMKGVDACNQHNQTERQSAEYTTSPLFLLS